MITEEEGKCLRTGNGRVPSFGSGDAGQWSAMGAGQAGRRDKSRGGIRLREDAEVG